MSTAEHKETVVAYLHQALNDKQPAEAAEAYLGPRYIQHNPQVADGAEAFVGFITGFTQQFPDLHLDIKRVIAEGDLVVTHSLVTVHPDDRGSAVMDIFRLADGKIVEHWDVLQPVPEEAANTNTMF